MSSVGLSDNFLDIEGSPQSRIKLTYADVDFLPQTRNAVDIFQHLAPYLFLCSFRKLSCLIHRYLECLGCHVYHYTTGGSFCYLLLISLIALSLPSVTISSSASPTIFLAFFSFSCSGGRNLPSTKSVIFSASGLLSF